MKNYPYTIKSFDDITQEYKFILINLSGNIGFDDDIEIEINRKFVMEIVASFEAKTVYYFRKIAKRKFLKTNVNISETIKKVIKDHQRYLMLNHIESIFLYMIQPLSNKIYADFLALTAYRNWIAHGRGWDYDPKWNKFDFQYSFDTISSVIELIKDYPEDLKN